MRAALVVVVAGIMLLAPFEMVANARGYGYVARSWHFAPRYRVPRPNRAFRRRLPSSGLVVVPSYAPDSFVGYPPEAPPAPSCREIVTVPSEDGGTRQITVTRCDQ
jgi:hypothetical protein